VYREKITTGNIFILKQSKFKIQKKLYISDHHFSKQTSNLFSWLNLGPCINYLTVCAVPHFWGLYSDHCLRWSFTVSIELYLKPISHLVYHEHAIKLPLYTIWIMNTGVHIPVYWQNFFKHNIFHWSLQNIFILKQSKLKIKKKLYISDHDFSKQTSSIFFWLNLGPYIDYLTVCAVPHFWGLYSDHCLRLFNI
jgi:hypothetical protein